MEHKLVSILNNIKAIFSKSEEQKYEVALRKLNNDLNDYKRKTEEQLFQIYVRNVLMNDDYILQILYCQEGYQLILRTKSCNFKRVFSYFDVNLDNEYIYTIIDFKQLIMNRIVSIIELDRYGYDECTNTVQNDVLELMELIKAKTCLLSLRLNS